MNFNDVLVIISTAINNNLDIVVDLDNVTIYNGDKYIEFELFEDTNDLLVTTSNNGEIEIKNLTENEILRYKLTCNNLEKYRENKAIDFINSFFPPKQEAKDSKNIDDLDDDE